MPARPLAAALALLLCAVAGAAPIPVLAQSGTAAFAPPMGPVILTRTVYRPLASGGEIVVARRYEVHFSRDSYGFRVDGKLLDVRVDAPPQLAGLAALERSRSDGELFPIFLDPRGLIVNPDRTGDNSALANRAITGAQALLFDASLPLEVRHEIAAALDTVAQEAQAATWPRFLFNPGASEQSAVHEIALPDGSVGQVEVRVRAERTAAANLPRLIERSITTHLSATRRTSREVWTLSD